MEKHVNFLARRCRLCGRSLPKSRNVQNCLKTGLRNEILKFYNVDIALDSKDVHPESVCPACKRELYRLNSGSLDKVTAELKKRQLKLFEWKEHCETCYCLQRKRVGRPPLKRARQESDTESGRESESEREKDGCLAFNQLLDMLPTLDKDLAVSLSCKLAEHFNFAFCDLDNLNESVAHLNKDTLLKLTETIFNLQTDNVKKDILSCSQTYKSLPGLLKLQPDSWLEGRNEVLAQAVIALCHSNVKPVQKTVAVDQLYSLVQPSYVSPFMFAANLLVYSIARSKLATNIYGKIFPTGASSTVRAWLNKLTMDVPQVPSGDILTSIDNDQVLIKKWTVRKDNRAQISILTSVCIAEIDHEGVKQKKKSLAPRYVIIYFE